MAFTKDSFQALTTRLPYKNVLCFYITNDNEATVGANKYFDGVADQLRVGDVIQIAILNNVPATRAMKFRTVSQVINSTTQVVEVITQAYL